VLRGRANFQKLRVVEGAPEIAPLSVDAARRIWDE
jgi:hypothetical protein